MKMEKGNHNIKREKGYYYTNKFIMDLKKDDRLDDFRKDMKQNLIAGILYLVIGIATIGYPIHKYIKLKQDKNYIILNEQKKNLINNRKDIFNEMKYSLKVDNIARYNKLINKKHFVTEKYNKLEEKVKNLKKNASKYGLLFALGAMSLANSSYKFDDYLSDKADYKSEKKFLVELDEISSRLAR